MYTKYRTFLQYPFPRFLFVELLIFGLVGLLSLLAHVEYSTGLFIAGGILLTLRFSTTAKLPNKWVGSYTMEKQYLDDVQNTQKFRRGLQLSNDLFIIGLVPLIVGFILAFA